MLHAKRTVESVQAVEVAFDRGGPHLDDVLRRLPGVTDVARLGDKLRLYALEPPALLPLLFDLAEQRGLRILSLNTLGPTLEDVFVELVGRGFEEAAVEHPADEVAPAPAVPPSAHAPGEPEPEEVAR